MKTEYRVDREEYQAGTRTERGGHRLQAALRGSVGSAPGSEGDADALRPAAVTGFLSEKREWNRE